jgi:hypothetical protein
MHASRLPHARETGGCPQLQRFGVLLSRPSQRSLVLVLSVLWSAAQFQDSALKPKRFGQVEPLSSVGRLDLAKRDPKLVLCGIEVAKKDHRLGHEDSRNGKGEKKADRRFGFDYPLQAVATFRQIAFLNR